MSKFLTIITILCSIIAGAQSSEASLTYNLDIAPDGGTFIIGHSVSASLVLTEIDDGLGGNPATALATGSGIVGIAVRMEQLTGNAILSNFKLADGLVPFGVNPSPNPTETETAWEFNAVAVSGVPPGLGVDSPFVVVGTFDILIGSADSIFGLSNLATTPLPSNLGIGMNAFSQRPDFVSNYGQSTFMVTAVPEPSIFALLAASCGLGFFLKKRHYADC